MAARPQENKPVLFRQGWFAPELIADSRTRAILVAAVTRSGPSGPSAFLEAAIASGDAAIRGTLARAVYPGFAIDTIVARMPQTRGTDGIGNNLTIRRDSFPPATLKALDEFDAVLSGSGGAIDDLALELLLHFVLLHMTDEDRRVLEGLDIPRAAALFREQVALRMEPHFSAAPRQTGAAAYDVPFRLPPQLAASEDLTHRVKWGTVAGEFPFEGEPRYERLFDCLARALHRQQCHHVLLCGERGVGKSAILAEMARRSVSGRIPFLASRRFILVDCRFFAPDESRQRLGAILAHVADNPELIVCLDGFVNLLQGEHSLSNRPALLGALVRVRCRVIGLVTPREYAGVIVDDPDLGEFFSMIEVEEPNTETSLRLLQHYALGLSERFKVTIENEAIRQAVLLSANYILNDQLPSKAVRLLLRVCEEIDYERSQLGGKRSCVTADDVLRVVSQVSGLPEETLRGVGIRSDYEQSLSELIFGQADAVRQVAIELGLIKSGMTDPDKPASVMLFLGQTGTGKTELAKAVARFYSTSKRLKTYTLGNCVEPHSVSTIIGVPPGYVGHDQGGRLINDLNADPNCVFLLDEADKAHPDVLQPFLNLFDEGWVADQRGNRAFGNKSIFILTSNVGQRMIADLVQQGKSNQEISMRMIEALSQIRHSKSDRPVFTPEFLARLKRVIVFNPLDQVAMARIAAKRVAEVKEAWQLRRGKGLQIPTNLTEHLGALAHRLNDQSSGKEGGRIARKLISEWIEAPLQREVSQRQDAYKHCDNIVLKFEPRPVESDCTPQPTDVHVLFQ